MFQNLQFVTFQIINFQISFNLKNNWYFNWLKGKHGRKSVSEYINKKAELRF